MKKQLGAGIVAGVVATVPMTAWMLVSHRLWRLGKLPPKCVAMGLASKVHAKPAHGRARNVFTTITHLGFGGVMGALHHVLPWPRALVERRHTRGVALGLGVWAASYCGWVPALGLMPAPQSDERRQLANVVAHVIYGLSLTALAAR